MATMLLLEDLGFFIAYSNAPDFDWAAMSAHVTLVLPLQPSRWAELCFTPSTIGDSMIFVCVTIRPDVPCRSVRYLPDENHARCDLSPLGLARAPSGDPGQAGGQAT